MFELNCRFQIAAILFLLVILFDYVKNKKIPLLSTKFFSLMLGFATINILADLFTVFTITHMDSEPVVPAIINRLAHQLFIGSLNCVIVSLYFYVTILGKGQKRMTKFHIMLRLIPFLIAEVMVPFGQITFYCDGKYVYSYGTMTYMIYISVAFYMICIFVDLHRYRETISHSKVLAIRVGASIWIAAAIFQMIFPTYLVSGLFSILMIFFIYLSFENPKEHIDSEVGCFNKRAFHLMLSDMLGSRKKFYVFDIVFENILTINNKFGHEFGNKLLGSVAEYVSSLYDTRVYHYRSDSLSIIIRGDEIKIMGLTKQLQERFQEAWVVNENTLTVDVHVDAIECPKYAVTTDEIYDIMNYMASYQETANVFIRIIDEGYVEKKRRYTRVEEIVRAALDSDGFDVVYQPIYSVSDRSFVSAEALVRLKDTKTLGFIGPDEFIPIAEKTGMIMQLGDIVFRKVCRFANENCIKNFGVHYIEVNLSGIQCIDHGLPNQLRNIMKENRIEPDFINLEITETAAIDSGDMLRRNMTKLRTMGCSFSMDDFGTGYSNLSQMADVNYDLVKLDKSLVWPCFGEDNKNPIVILENVVNMLLQLDVKIVAEGVETLEQANKLTLMGVDYMQGYYYSKPVNEVDYVAFLAVHNK